MMDYLGDGLLDATPVYDIPPKVLAARSISEVDRRSALISAAETVFLAKGYVATTMADIAAAAGMSKKTIYQLFESKTELFDTLILEGLSALPAIVPPGEGPVRQALHDMMMAFGRALLSPRQISLTRLILANIASVPQANLIVTRRLAAIESGLSDWLAVAVARGIFQITDLASATETLFSLAFASLRIELLLMLRDTPTEDELARKIDDSIDIFMREFSR